MRQKSNAELIRKLVLNSIGDQSVFELEDEAYRWYSKTFHEPLSEVYKMPAEIVLYFKWKEELSNLDEGLLQEEKERFCQPEWNIVLQPDSKPKTNTVQDDDDWILQEEEKLKKESQSVTTPDVIKQTEDAIRALTTKLSAFKDDGSKD